VRELPPPGWSPPTKVETRERRKVRFYWIRAVLGMTQQEVAEHYDVDPRLWRYYERDGTRPGHDLVAKIAEETGFSPAWILGEVD